MSRTLKNRTITAESKTETAAETSLAAQMEARAAATTTSTARKVTVSDRLRLRLGVAGTKTLMLSLGLALRAVAALFFYMVAIYTAVSVIPNMAAFLQQGTGITLTSRPDALFAGWIMPVIFLTLLILVLELVAMRHIWRLVSKLLVRIKASLFRIDEEERAAEDLPAGKLSKKALSVNNKR